MLATEQITPRKIRVMLVDDSQILLSEAVWFLSDHPALEVIKSVYRATHALAQAKLYAPDVVLLDITTSGLQALCMIHELHTVYPTLPVIVLDEIEVETVKRAALREGAASFVTKPIVKTQLFDAILREVRFDYRYA